MSKPYIKNGTPIGNESLCRTCSYAHIVTGYRESELITICTDLNPNLSLPFTVHNCTGYYDKNRPSWDQMKDLAIDVTPAPLKPVGFKVDVDEPVKVQTRVNVDIDSDEDDD
jgi:hypothetical protein